MIYRPIHACPDWDYLILRPGDPEWDGCTCTFKGWDVEKKYDEKEIKALTPKKSVV